MIKQRSSIMPALFDLLYREYCRARLVEMRSQLLLRSGTTASMNATSTSYLDDMDAAVADASAIDRDAEVEPSGAVQIRPLGLTN
jgi:hypothetical protein